MCWVNANFFCQGVPGMVGDGGEKEGLQRRTGGHFAGRVRPLHAVLLTKLLPTTLSLDLLSGNLARRPACVAAAEPVLAQRGRCSSSAACWSGQATLQYDTGL